MSDNTSGVRNEIDVEDYRGKTITTAIGDIRPFFGSYLDLFHCEGSEEQLPAFREMVAAVRGFHIIQRENGRILAAFDAESLPTVLKLAKSTTAVERHTTSLSASDVREIRERYQAGGVTQQKLAEEFGVCQKTISNAVRCKGPFRHVLAA